MWSSGAQRPAAEYSHGSHDYADQDVFAERHGQGRSGPESIGTHGGLFRAVIVGWGRRCCYQSDWGSIEGSIK